MKYLFTALICVCALAANAQGVSWKKHTKMADKLYEQGKYADAAEHYEAAWKQKKSKKELIYKAGECYYELKNFRKAADTYMRIKEEGGDLGLAGLKYARSLKQDGQYELAKKELLSYNKKYKGEDKKVVSRIVQKEIEGCDMGLSMKRKEDKSIVVELLSESINTLEDEFAPIPYSDDILYFSSTMAGEAKMYRSQRQSGVWIDAVAPDLPAVTGGQICHGTFTPDNKRFYFTVCETKGAWKGIKANCDLYVTKVESDGWSTPEKLRDYIRMEGTTATHPFVVHTDTEEILYFASDREGGFGGLDIWYAKRQLDSDQIDFTLPRNAGPRINTLGDEITPFYNSINKTLYFSSNGHVTFGGFDIFKASDLGNRFDQPEHLGAPMNSSNDDYNYIEESNGAGGFFVSNRLFGLGKISTIQNDIFIFTTPTEQLFVTGNILGQSKKPLNDVQVSLYELKNSNKKRLLQSKVSPNGAYQFTLLPNVEYKLEIEKDGYKSDAKRFSTFDHDDNSNYAMDFQLSAYDMSKGSVASKDPVFSESNSENGDRNRNGNRNETSTTQQRADQSQTRTTTPKKNIIINTAPTPPPPVAKTRPKRSTPSVPSEGPAHSGTYYKVQLTVAYNFNPNSSMFRDVKSMGRLDTQYIAEKNWYRVLLGDFFSLQEARDAMIKAQQYRFIDAFLVKYRDGRRMTP